MAYTFQKLASGNVDVLENGSSIYGAGTPGVTSAYAKTLGYSDPTADVATTPSGAKVNVNTGALISGPPVNVSTPSPIVYSADALSNPSTLFKSPTAPTPPNYSSLISSVPTIESIAGAKTPDQLKAESENKSLSDQILETMKGLGTKSVFQANEEANAGIPDLEKNLTDVNAQISVLQNEAKAIPLQIQNDSEGRARTAAGVAPLEADALRTNAIKALTLSSIAETYRGNLATAAAQVARAVAAEFDPKQSELDYLKAALQINASHMSEADREQAIVINAKIDERQKILDEAKANRQKTLDLVLQAGAAGAPATLLTKASAEDPETAVNTLATYLRNKSDLMTVSPGQTVLDPTTGKPVYTAPAKPGSDPSSITFSDAQVQVGAANAGVPLATFQTYDADTKNWFIRSFATFSALKKEIGTKYTKEEVAKLVQSSTTTPENVKPMLYKILGVTPPAAASAAPASGGGILSSVKNWLGDWTGIRF